MPFDLELQLCSCPLYIWGILRTCHNSLCYGYNYQRLAISMAGSLSFHCRCYFPDQQLGSLNCGFEWEQGNFYYLLSLNLRLFRLIPTAKITAVVARKQSQPSKPSATCKALQALIFCVLLSSLELLNPEKELMQSSIKTMIPWRTLKPWEQLVCLSLHPPNDRNLHFQVISYSVSEEKFGLF